MSVCVCVCVCVRTRSYDTPGVWDGWKDMTSLRSHRILLNYKLTSVDMSRVTVLFK